MTASDIRPEQFNAVLEVGMGAVLVDAMKRGHFTVEQLIEGMAAEIRPDLEYAAFLEHVIGYVNVGASEREAVRMIAAGWPESLERDG